MSDSGLPNPDDGFSLFDAEEQTLLDSEAMISQLREMVGGLDKLTQAYRRSYREKQRLVRLSDRMQQELQTTKAALAEQAKSLQALNESLRSEAEQRTRLAEELFRMATTDQLTGALSRRRLFDLGNYEIAKTTRSQDPLTILLLDLDHFKKINDSHGHSVGDDVLRHFAQIASGIIRKTDIFARYGGEEFVILLPNTAAEAGQEIAERLLATLAGTPLCIPPITITVTASVGLAQVQPGDEELEQVLLRADSALYEAKRSGRNRVIVAAPPHAGSP
jgi:diguanylate cyclase (GGDEF)-like protein